MNGASVGDNKKSDRWDIGVKRKALIIDVDMSIADTGRRFDEAGGSIDAPYFWIKFMDNDKQRLDRPYPHAAEILTKKAKKYEIIYLTGRFSHMRPGLIDWLEEHEFPAGQPILKSSSEQRMRDSTYKGLKLRQLMKEYDIEEFFDDQPQNCDVAMELGIPKVHRITRPDTFWKEYSWYASCKQAHGHYGKLERMLKEREAHAERIERKRGSVLSPTKGLGKEILDLREKMRKPRKYLERFCKMSRENFILAPAVFAAGAAAGAAAERMRISGEKASKKNRLNIVEMVYIPKSSKMKVADVKSALSKIGDSEAGRLISPIQLDEAEISGGYRLNPKGKITYTEERMMDLFTVKIYRNGKNVGYATYSISDEMIFIHLISIKEDFRRKGYGTALIKRIIQKSEKLHVPIVLYPMAMDKPLFLSNVIRFYKKLGFKISEDEVKHLEMVYYPKKRARNPRIPRYKSGFGFPKVGTKINGFTVKSLKVRHKVIKRYHKYKYPTEIVLIGKGDPRKALKHLNDITRIIYTRYGNPYRCQTGRFGFKKIKDGWRVTSMGTGVRIYENKEKRKLTSKQKKDIGFYTSWFREQGVPKPAAIKMAYSAVLKEKGENIYLNPDSDEIDPGYLEMWPYFEDESYWWLPQDNPVDAKRITYTVKKIEKIYTILQYVDKVNTGYLEIIDKWASPSDSMFRRIEIYEKFRRQGLAKEMMRYGIKYMQGKSDEVYLLAMAFPIPLERLIKFYNSFGFTVTYKKDKVFAMMLLKTPRKENPIVLTVPHAFPHLEEGTHLTDWAAEPLANAIYLKLKKMEKAGYVENPVTIDMTSAIIGGLTGALITLPLYVFQRYLYEFHLKPAIQRSRNPFKRKSRNMAEPHRANLAMLVGDSDRTIIDLNRPQADKTEWYKKLRKIVKVGDICLDIHSFPSTGDKREIDNWDKNDIVLLNVPKVTDMKLARSIKAAMKKHGFKAKIVEAAQYNWVQVTAHKEGGRPVLIELNENHIWSGKMGKIADAIIEGALAMIKSKKENPGYAEARRLWNNELGIKEREMVLELSGIRGERYVKSLAEPEFQYLPNHVQHGISSVLVGNISAL